MPSLHIFNPETDYALASGRSSYTAPALVRDVRMANALAPASYASEGDVILLADEPSGPLGELYCHDMAMAKKLRILTPSEAAKEKARLRGYQPVPWGWNLSIRNFLRNLIGDMPGLPDDAYIEKIRNLSHRRTSTLLLERMGATRDKEVTLPVEIDETSIAMQHVAKGDHLYFKAPWSSSGRGVICTESMTLPQIEKWISGIIRRQGSVMMEKAYRRSLDFATEWTCHDGNAEFMGFSVFNASESGRYEGNLMASQNELYGIVNSATGGRIDSILKMQQEALNAIVAPQYDGPLGLDMLVTESGAVNPCVEINLRHTMGMVQLYRSEFLNNSLKSDVNYEN